MTTIGWIHGVVVLMPLGVSHKIPADEIIDVSIVIVINTIQVTRIHDPFNVNAIPEHGHAIAIGIFAQTIIYICCQIWMLPIHSRVTNTHDDLLRAIFSFMNVPGLFRLYLREVVHDIGIEFIIGGCRGIERWHPLSILNIRVLAKNGHHAPGTCIGWQFQGENAGQIRKILELRMWQGIETSGYPLNPVCFDLAIQRRHIE